MHAPLSPADSGSHVLRTPTAPLMLSVSRRATGLVAALCIASALPAQQPAAPKYDRNTYEHTSADIPMRDGLTLHVEIYAPSDATSRSPFSSSARHTASKARAAASPAVTRTSPRRVHLRLPGHPRAVQERGHVRHAAPAGPVDRRSQGHRRRDRHATTPSTGCSRTCRRTTAASACSASATTAG